MEAQCPLIISGLSDIEAMELEEEVPSWAIESQSRVSADGGDHGDLGLTAVVVILSAATINALSLWLAKRRERAAQEDLLLVTKGADGSLTLYLQHRSESAASESPDADVIKDYHKDYHTQLSSLLPATGS